MKKILLVEDEIMIAMLEMEQLRHGGYEITHVQTGEAAVETASSMEFDLILMDINLGSGIDGTEAAQTILKSRNLPVVFLSSHMEKEVVEKTEKITSYGYILKNSGQFVLLTSIKMAFKLFEANSEISSHKTLLEDLNENLISANEDLAQTIDELEDTNRLLSKSLSELEKKENETEWLLNSMSNAFVLYESVFNDAGEFVSYRFLYINKAYENTTGLKINEVRGKTVHEIWPNIGRGWVEKYGSVAVSGCSLEFEAYHEPTGRMLHCNAYRPWDSQARFCVIFEDVTELKKNTEELYHVRNRYSRILETVLDGVVMVNTEGHIIYANTAAQKILEIKKDEINSRYYNDPAWKQIDINGDFLEPEKLPLYMSLNEKKDISAFVHGIITDDGRMKFISINSSPLFSSTGELTGAVASFRDITKIKLIEEQVLESRANYQLVVDSIEESLAVIDSEGKIIFINEKGALALTGELPEHLIGRNINEFRDTQQAADLISRYTEVISTGNSVTQDVKVKTDEDEICFHNRLIPVSIGLPPRKAVMWISMDITGRKKTEEELQKINKIFTYSIDLLSTIGSDGYLKLFNPVWGKITGWNDEQLLSKPWIEFIHQDDRQSSLEMFDKAMKGHEIYGFENRYMCSGGSFRWFAWNLFPHPEEDIIFGIARDITEKKSAELFHALTGDALRILNESKNFSESSEKILALIKEKTGCEAAGIRLEADDDFPYFRQKGFDDEFIMTENSLTARTEKGEICRSSDGKAMLECTCGMVLSGKADLSSKFFTQSGSFWINDLAVLLDTDKFPDARLNPRNTCILRGYASIVLVPIKTKNRIAGLLQLNDRRKSFFTESFVRSMEALSSHIGEALIRKRTEDRLIVALQESDMLKARAEKLSSEKELLLHEVHHRIKNNMNTICGVLTLQANSSGNADTSETLKEATGRVHSMMTLYDKLYRSDDFSVISLKVYLNSLISEIVSIFPNHNKVTTEVELQDIMLSPDILSPLGIIINELITNTMKYAFTDRESGIIRIRASETEMKVTLTYENNGIPMPENLAPDNAGSFGMKLISLLIIQIKGTMRITRDNGTKFEITFFRK